MINNREFWLSNAVEGLQNIFTSSGLKVPPVRVSCGFASSGCRSKHIGECWTRESNSDGINQIFISPMLDDSVLVLETLTHELCHAVDNCQSGHGKEFKLIARAVGLQGPMRSTNAGPLLLNSLKNLSTKIGRYPHSKLIKQASATKSNNTRAKAKCSKCGFEVTMIKKFLSFGPPICPVHEIRMRQIGNWDIETK